MRLWPRLPWRRKESAVGPLIAFVGHGAPRLSKRTSKAFADEGYSKNVIVYRCVKLVACEAAKVELKLFRRSRGGDLQAVEDHDLLDLLKRPNPMQGGAALFESVYAWKLVDGNSYVERVLVGGGRPAELWSLPATQFRVLPGETGLPKGFEFSAGTAKKIFDVDPIRGTSDILHIKDWNPLDWWYGLSPLAAAAVSVDQHNAAGIWNKALLDNSAQPSGALVYKPKDGEAGVLTDEQFRRLKQQVAEQYEGARNAGRPLVLEGGMEWQAMAFSPKDAEHIAGKKLSAIEIALAYNVPPELVGLTEHATFNNRAEAKLDLYEQAVLPLVDHVLDEFNNWLTPLFGDDLVLGIDEDSIPALEPRREKRFDRAVRAVDAGLITINEGRDMIGREDVDGGDVIFVNAGKLPLDFVDDGTEEPEADPEPTEPDDPEDSPPPPPTEDGS